MKFRILLVLLNCLALSVLAAQTNNIAIYPDNDPLTSENLKLVWPAIPGLRYEVQQSTNLQIWTTAPGYPAKANGPAQQMPFQSSGSSRFYRVKQFDDQSPAIVSQYPTDGGFAVPKFSNLTFQLSDATGIDTNSIQLTVGDLGTFALANSQLTFSNGLLTFIDGGNVPLGGWGSNVVVTLAMADTLGHATTNITTFTLEIQPQVVANLFVFGSPQAQRAGQLVGNIPTRALAQQSGPMPMGAGEPWTLDLVASNRLELTYTNTAPGFTVGQYVCNLTPATIDDIFYRKITSLTDDPGNKRLTLFTTNVPLAEMLQNGSASISPNSIIYEVTNNVIAKAFAFNGVIPLSPIGVDTNATLYDANGVTLSLEEAKFLFTPSLALSFETHYFKLTKFSASLNGKLETAVVPRLTLSGALSDTKDFDLFSRKIVVFVGYAGPIPVWLDFNLGVTAEVGYNLSASATMTTGVRQNANLTFGVDYDKDRSPQLEGNPSITFDPLEIDPFSYQLDGSGSAYAKIVPQLDVKVDSLAGLYANVDPRVEINGRATINNGQLSRADFSLSAKADLNVGLNVIGIGNVDPPLATFSLFNYPWSVSYPPPATLTINRPPQSQTASVGGTVTFSVDANSAQPITYQWFNNGSQMQGQTASSLTLNNVTLGYAGQYSVQVTSGGITTNLTTTLTVEPLSAQSGLVSWYPFNGNALDASGYGNDAIVHGAPTYLPGVVGESAYLDGSGSYFESPVNLNAFTNVTMAFWIKLGSLPGNRNQLVSNDSGNWGRVINVLGSSYMGRTGDLEIWNSSDNSPGYWTTPLQTNTWYHIVGVWTAQSTLLYVNGNLVLSGLGSISGLNDLNNVQIGAGHLSDYTHGQFDDLRIYNRALSASEILSLYNASLSTPVPSSGMALIPAGSFTMGDSMGDSGTNSDELPLHTVYVSAFYMDKYDVTEALWQKVFNWATNHGYSFDDSGSVYNGDHKGPNYPVVDVSWYDCVKWCNARSEMEGRTPAYYTDASQTMVYRAGDLDISNNCVNWNAGYRLPTEAEWEKAARGGLSGQRFPWGNTINENQANYNAAPSSLNSFGFAYDVNTYSGSNMNFSGNNPRTNPVNYFAPNGYGLYDMAGNVRQWCWDLYDDTWYGQVEATQSDTRGPLVSILGYSIRVLRGGLYCDYACFARCADRVDFPLDASNILSCVGFRCVVGGGSAL